MVYFKIFTLVLQVVDSCFLFSSCAFESLPHAFLVGFFVVLLLFQLKLEFCIQHVLPPVAMSASP